MNATQKKREARQHEITMHAEKLAVDYCLKYQQESRLDDLILFYELGYNYFELKRLREKNKK